MVKTFKNISRQKLMIAFCCLFMIGLYFSRALLSISTVLLFLNAITHPQVRLNFARFLQNKPAVLLTALFFMTIVSGIFSENTSTWLEWIRIKSSFLILPFSIASLPPLKKKEYQGLLYFFLLITLFSALVVGIEYLQHFKDYTGYYNQGGSIWTPIIYVRYSLFLAFAITIGGYLFFSDYYFKFRQEKYFIGIASLFLIFFLHILAVRTGLFAFYNVLIVSVFYFTIKQKKWIFGLLLLAGVILTPPLAYQNIPSLRNKINYMKWDLQLYFDNDMEHMGSDYRRLISIENGIKVAKNNSLLFGCGIGDLRDEMNKLYHADNGQEHKVISKKLLPHNQYIFIFASMGIVGLLIFIFVTFYPLFFRQNYQFWFFVCFHIVTFSSFLAETTIELQIGNSYYLLFVLIGLSYLFGRR